MHLGYWDVPPRPGEPLPAAFWSAGEFREAQRRLDERVLALAALGPGMRVLDAGCGFGGTLEAVNGRHAGMDLCGVNVDPRQLEICRGVAPANGNRLSWIEADACALPFPGGSFDRVLCVEAMFHFSSRRHFFREAARVLAPGGALVGTDITVAASARTFDSAGFPVARTLQAGYGPWPDVWGEDANHRELASDAGLKCAAWEDAGAQTLPSHHFTSPEADHIRGTLAAGGANRALLAALMLKWLHREGHLAYPFFRFDKPGAGA